MFCNRNKMKISSNTKKTVAELTEYSNGKLKNASDIETLIELSALSGKDKLFYDIQFAAKYLNGLGKILQSNVAITTQKKPGENGEAPPSAEEAREKIMGEYKSNMIRLSNYLADLLIDADEEVKTDFRAKYLSMNRTSLVNMTGLIYDLSWLKRYYNSKR